MPRRALLLFVLPVLGAACERPRVSDPQGAVRAYAAAAEHADPDALFRMLSRRSQKELGKEGVVKLVTDSRPELMAQGRALRTAGAPVEAEAVVRYEDGEHAVLELEDGVFKVSSAAALPASPQTPAQALGVLRQALARRSYTAFLRVLSAETQSALESDLAAIVKGLEDPETLNIETEGDDAQVDLPGGHVIKLKREAGAWRVEDVK